MNYTVDYFINKFEKIPEEMWCTHTVDNDNGQHCAWGLIKYSKYKTSDCFTEGAAFMDIIKSSGLDVYGDPSRINNGDDPRYPQPTPKQRILAALYDIKKLQEPKVKERIVYVSVAETIKQQAAELINN